MPPGAKKDQSALKRNRPSSPDLLDVKKLRRSNRLQALPPATNDSAAVTTATKDKSNEQTPPVTTIKTPESSPPPDTQVQSQFYFPPPSQIAEEESKDVWGHLTPLDSKHGEVLTLTKRSACSQSDSTKSGKKKGTTKASKPHLTNGYIIGRHPECDIVVDLPVVSNRHCVIFTEISGTEPIAILEDLSSNGTWISNVIVGRNNRRTLKQGDEISIPGGATFLFRYPTHSAASRFRDSYELGKQLGSGHFATVHIATDKRTGTPYAVKIFRKRRNDDKSKTLGLQQEIAVLMSVSHENVLCLKETFDEEDSVYLVLELASEGELFNYIIEKGKLSEDETRKVFIQLLNGLKYLHERSIVHRDIKPENILICDKNLTVKLADFGLAKIIGDDSFTTSLCGTPSYVAPEILENHKNRKYSKPVDVWSLGVVLYISLCGFPPFSDELYSEQNPYNLTQQIKLGRFDFPSPYWDNVGDPALDLIERMLTVDPDERITVEEALEHPWVTNKSFSVTESTDSLTGAFNGINLARRGVTRERTLLSDAVRITKHTKNASDNKSATKHKENQKTNGATVPTTAFMKVGGKGLDETLYRGHEIGNSNDKEEIKSLF